MKVQTEVLHGRPLKAEGRELVPVVRRTTGMWRQATIGSGLTARGGGFVHLHPLGVVERQGDEERFIPIPDKTGEALLGLLAMALAVPPLLLLASRLARR